MSAVEARQLMHAVVYTLSRLQNHRISNTKRQNGPPDGRPGCSILLSSPRCPYKFGFPGARLPVQPERCSFCRCLHSCFESFLKKIIKIHHCVSAGWSQGSHRKRRVFLNVCCPVTLWSHLLCLHLQHFLGYCSMFSLSVEKHLVIIRR